MRIWKFPLKIERHQMVVIVLTLWASVPIDRGIHPDSVERDLSIIGTGNDLPSGQQTYVATAQQGPYVWHLFDGGEC